MFIHINILKKALYDKRVNDMHAAMTHQILQRFVRSEWRLFITWCVAGAFEIETEISLSTRYMIHRKNEKKDTPWAEPKG